MELRMPRCHEHLRFGLCLLFVLVGTSITQAQVVTWKGRTWQNLYGTESLSVNPSTGYLDITIGAGFGGFGGAYHQLPGSGPFWIQAQFIDDGGLQNTPSPSLVAAYFDTPDSAYIALLGGENGRAGNYATVRREQPRFTVISQSQTTIGQRSPGMHCVAIVRRVDAAIEYWLDGVLKHIYSSALYPGPIQYAYLLGQANQSGQKVSFVNYSQGAGAYPISGCACGKPTFTGSYPTSSSPQSTGTTTGWHMSYAVTPDRGLELSDVSLGSRYMAKSMSLPYFYLKLNGSPGFPDTRCTLTPNGNLGLGAACTSRLVDFTFSGGMAPEIKATYEVNNIPSGSDACVEITQHYQFTPPIYPALSGGPGCEPLDSLACATFKPVVSYKFFAGSSAQTLNRINTAQRLHFSVDAPNPSLASTSANTSAVFADCDVLGCNPLTGSPLFRQKINPLTAEFQGNAIVGGITGSWDNYHQTNNNSVKEPKALPPTPGCPECIHMHWRWGAPSSYPPPAGGGPSFGNGAPLVNGSNQSVQIAVVRYRPLISEESPLPDFNVLVSGESLIGQPRVFWYSAAGFQPADTFFNHGAFFSPPDSGPANLSAIITKSRSGNTVTIFLRLTNNGPGRARNVSLNQLLPRVLTGTGTITFTGPSLPLSIGDLAAGQLVDYAFPFNVPTTVQRFSLAEGLSFQDDFGRIHGVSLRHTVIP